MRSNPKSLKKKNTFILLQCNQRGELQFQWCGVLFQRMLLLMCSWYFLVYCSKNESGIWLYSSRTDSLFTNNQLSKLSV